MGSGVLVGDFLLAGKGVGVGHEVAVANLSALSATVSAPGGAQDPAAAAPAPRSPPPFPRWLFGAAIWNRDRFGESG